jgi:hypothetical protein
MQLPQENPKDHVSSQASLSFPFSLSPSLVRLLRYLPIHCQLEQQKMMKKKKHFALLPCKVLTKKPQQQQHQRGITQASFTRVSTSSCSENFCCSLPKTPKPGIRKDVLTMILSFCLG